MYIWRKIRIYRKTNAKFSYSSELYSYLFCSLWITITYCIIFMYYYITTITLQHRDIEKYHLYNETMSRKLRH